MLKAKAPSPIPYLLGAIVLLAIGNSWFHGHVSTGDTPTEPITPEAVTALFPPPTAVPTGTIVEIDGSTSMVTINQNLRQAFERRFSGTQVNVQTNGSTQGIQSLLSGLTDLAAISRPLNQAEMDRGLRAVEVARDAIAIVVGRNNSFNGSLTPQQVQGIFRGTIVNWSQVGGPNRMIRVINRPPISGTHQTFKDLVLQGRNFGTTTNITTLAADATTPLLRALGNDGIGYATDAQVLNQQTVRVVPVNGLRPDQPNYPYQRTLSYAYQDQGKRMKIIEQGF